MTLFGTLPMVALAPQEYRYALDAAMSVLSRYSAPRVQCHVPELMGEVNQRLPGACDQMVAGKEIPACLAALWVEPLVDSWQAELGTLSRSLAPHSPLLVMASRPLARRLPERRPWQRGASQPLGMQRGGIHRLSTSLGQAGFTITAHYGIHTLYSIGLNFLSQQCQRRGFPDLADRIHFAARLRYATSGVLASLSTVALWIAQKEQS